MSAGCVSKLSLFSDSMIQGCFLRVQKCTVGGSHEVSSKVPALTLRTAERMGPAQIHEPHLEQIHNVSTRPLVPVRWTACGSPARRWKLSTGRTIAIENALLVMRWQSVQWQA